MSRPRGAGRRLRFIVSHGRAPAFPESAHLGAQFLVREAVVVNHCVGAGAARAPADLLRQHGLHGLARPTGTRHHAVDLRGLAAVDQVVICAGQEPQRELLPALQAAGCSVHLIGGADVAAELDAKRAIHQGTTLAAQL